MKIRGLTRAQNPNGYVPSVLQICQECVGALARAQLHNLRAGEGRGFPNDYTMNYSYWLGKGLIRLVITQYNFHQSNINII